MTYNQLILHFNTNLFKKYEEDVIFQIKKSKNF